MLKGDFHLRTDPANTEFISDTIWPHLAKVSSFSKANLAKYLRNGNGGANTEAS